MVLDTDRWHWAVSTGPRRQSRQARSDGLLNMQGLGQVATARRKGRAVAEHSLLAADARTDLVSGGVPSRERDIGVVLVTGAGASRAFGVNGKPMPLMGDWSDDLVRKLASRTGYREVTQRPTIVRRSRAKRQQTRGACLRLNPASTVGGPREGGSSSAGLVGP